MPSMVVAIYTHPELYPPVLNSIDELSIVFDKVIVVSRNLSQNYWVYPENVKFSASGEYVPVSESERKSTRWKFISFIKFTRHLHKTLKMERPLWVMCNDPISLMAFRLVRPMLKSPIQLWYHSHDVAEIGMMRKFSVGYFSVKSERKYFNQIDLFTLPAESRLSYFPVDQLKGQWLVVPNFPSKIRIFKKDSFNLNPDRELKLIYQGRISNEHGLEEAFDFISSMPVLKMTIIGPGDDKYIQILKDKIESLQIADRVVITEPVPYAELSGITKKTSYWMGR